jgi:two-component system NtrC family sensor kinase
MKLTRTIAFRLFLLIASLQTIILLALTYATVKVQQTSLMENVTLSAVRVTDIIARATRYSMLLNRKEDVQSIVGSLREEPGIEGVRIYNKQGEVVFAAIPGDIGAKVDMTAEACVTCHPGSGLDHATATSEELSRIFSKPNGERVLGLITPVRNEPECSSGECHAHPENKTILGVLDVKMSLAAVDEQLLSSRTQLLALSALSVVLIGLVAWGFIWVFVRRPVRGLTAGMEMVTSGNLHHRIPVGMNDEIGQLARAFNTMTEELERARKEITAWSGTLERKVHEKTADLEKAHNRILRVEKMASLGHLSSSVAHELNNPLEGILTFAKLIAKRIQRSSLTPEEKQLYGDELRLIAEEALRSGNIVKNLLVFARQGSMSIQPVRLRTIVDRCVLLVNHHANIQGVEVAASCPESLQVECDAGQIQQLLIALMMNAIEAMAPTAARPGGGSLAIDAFPGAQGDTVILTVRDTGQGMTEEIKARIFEPFFTTKSEGKGVGLGLAIVYGIVERHHGAIEVESQSGRGTVFTVTLPVKQPVEPAAATQGAAPPEGA